MKELFELSKLLFSNAVFIVTCFSLCGTIFIVNTKYKKLQILEWSLWLGLFSLFLFSVILGFAVYPLPVILVIIVVVFFVVRYFFVTILYYCLEWKWQKMQETLGEWEHCLLVCC